MVLRLDCSVVVLWVVLGVFVVWLFGFIGSCLGLEVGWLTSALRCDLGLIAVYGLANL